MVREGGKLRCVSIASRKSEDKTMEFDAIILGAGAAGLMAALRAGQRGRRVLLLDHAEKPGKKILISGGGRCNFTNIYTSPERFLSQNRHFAKSALGRFTPQDFLAMVERHGIAWHEKTLGQLFCNGSAREIVAMLIGEVQAAGVDMRMHHRVSAVDHRDGRFYLTTDHGDYQAPHLVVATGGPSIPKMGATGFAYALAARFDVPVITPRAALVPLLLDMQHSDFMALSGVAFESVAHFGKQQFREASLFTHRGLSGPAILQISSYWDAQSAIHLNLLPDQQAAALLLGAKRERPRAEMTTCLAQWLPHRLAQVLAGRLALEGPLAGMSDQRLVAAGKALNHWAFQPSGTEGFAKAEVTAGGIDTQALSSRTMMSTTVPGLYFIGEAVDVTGWLGGYNFQWAWASGYAAGEAV